MDFSLILAGLVFLGIHIIPATRLRRDAVALVGEGPYLGLFSLLSLISIWWWVGTFRSAPFDTPLWYYPECGRGLRRS
jgi:uncharacterized membrane protein